MEQPIGQQLSELDGFIDSLADACLVVNSGAYVSCANSSARELYGFDPVGRALAELCVDAQAAAAITENVSSCCNGPRAFSAECIKDDGSVFVGEFSAKSCTCPDGTLAMLVVRELRQRLDRCVDSLEVARTLLDETSDAIVAHTLDGQLIHANRTVLEQCGATLTELKAAGEYSWVPVAQRPMVAERSRELESVMENRYESHTSRDDGTFAAIEVHSRLVDGPDGSMVVSSARDISERLESEEMVRYLAYHDMLTGLANRVLLDSELAAAIVSSDRHGDVVGVIFLDLDDFKPVNDNFGHAIGDHVLRKVADRLVGAVRETDTVARLGGDEFVVLCPRLNTPLDLSAVARKLCTEVRRPVLVGGAVVNVTASLGLAVHVAGEDAETLLTRADLAMYRTRERGCQGWELFDPLST